MGLDIDVIAIQTEQGRIAKEFYNVTNDRRIEYDSRWALESYDPKVHLFLSNAQCLDGKKWFTTKDGTAITEEFINRMRSKYGTSRGDCWWSVVKLTAYVSACKKKFGDDLRWMPTLLEQRGFDVTKTYLLAFGDDMPHRRTSYF